MAAGGGVPHNTPPPLPLPFTRLGQIFFRASGQSNIFPGAFRANYLRPKFFFGAIGTSQT